METVVVGVSPAVPHANGREFKLVQCRTHHLRSAKAVESGADFSGEDVGMRWEVAQDFVKELCWEVGERHLEIIR